MQTRLNDTQRVLISAYHDGELSPGEQAEAARLLEESEVARQFLGDLRALNRLSVQAFPPVPVDPSAAAGGSVIGAKLTSSAIQSAARAGSAAGSTTMTAGTWSMAGLAAAAVTAVAVVAITGVGTPDHRSAAPTVAASIAPTPVSFAVDSASLVVPEMSAQEVFDFAVNGRLPIDGDRYLTLDRGQEGAMAIKVADRSSSPALPQLSLAALSQIPGLDSIEFALRTSLLRSKEHGLAVRADLPKLRARALQQINGVANQMPASLRRAMDEARDDLEREMEALEQEYRRSAIENRREAAGENAVRYFVISDSQTGSVDETAGPGVAPGGQRPLRAVAVSREALGNLEVYVRAPGTASTAVVYGNATPRAMATRQVRREAPVGTGAVPQTPRPKAPSATWELGDVDAWGRGEWSYGFGDAVDIDSVLRIADEMIIRTEQLIERADSLRNVVRLRIERYSREHPRPDLALPPIPPVAPDPPADVPEVEVDPGE